MDYFKVLTIKGKVALFKKEYFVQCTLRGEPMYWIGSVITIKLQILPVDAYYVYCSTFNHH